MILNKRFSKDPYKLPGRVTSTIHMAGGQEGGSLEE